MINLNKQKLAKEKLCKGIRGHRFRSTKSWKPQYEILYGLMIISKIGTAQLGELVGRCQRTVERWIYEGHNIPQEIQDKLEYIFGYPKAILCMKENMR